MSLGSFSGSFSQDPLFKAFSTSASTTNANNNEGMIGNSSTTPNSAPAASSTTTTNSENFPAGSRLFSYMQPPTGAAQQSWAQLSSRKLSHPSTMTGGGGVGQQQTSSSHLATSPSSPPQFASNMSPFANTFQPSSSKHFVQNIGFNHYQNNSTKLTSSSNALEHKFTNALSLRDHHDYQRQTQALPQAFDAAALHHLGHSISTPAFNSLDGNGGGSQMMLPHPYQTANDFNAGSLPTPPNSMSAMPSLNQANVLRRKISKSPAIGYTPGVTAPNMAVVKESIGGTTYFFNAQMDNQARQAQELRGHEDQIVDGNQQASIVLPDLYAYAGPPPNVAHYKPRGGLGFTSFFAPNEMKLELMHRQLLCMAQTDPEEMPELPQEVDCYHRLVPLESLPIGMLAERPGYFGAVTTVYKANSTKSGLAYCLRRIHNYRLTNIRCLTVIEAWKKLQHSNVVQIREVFTTKAFGDNSVVFVYDYYPTAETVKQRHFNRLTSTANGFGSSSLMDEMDAHRQNAQAKMINPKGNRSSIGTSPTSSGATNGGVGGNGLLPEAFIWCYIIQLSSALRQIHSMNLAARTIEPSKLLVMGKSRLLINCGGIFDMLTFDQMQQQPNILQHYQQEDLLNFGRLVLALACNNAMAAVQRDQWQQSIEFVSRNYSPDLKNLILYLVAPQRMRNVNDVMPMIGARFYTQLESAQNRIDMLENELTKEADNGRLFRLLCKLGAVNERPEFAMDSQWSETGDRYLLKLFRDYLFHQVTEDGRPWMDLAHAVQCLNKLDAGVSEKVMLSSRDQQNVLVVSYADLHRCLDQAFKELSRTPNVINADLSTVSGSAAEQGHYNSPANMNS